MTFDVDLIKSNLLEQQHSLDDNFRKSFMFVDQDDILNKSAHEQSSLSSDNSGEQNPLSSNYTEESETDNIKEICTNLVRLTTNTQRSCTLDEDQFIKSFLQCILEVP